jgi:hypothetical protein
VYPSQKTEVLDVDFSYSIKPHLIDIVTIFVLGELDTPLATVFVRLVLPSRDDSFLKVVLSTKKMIESISDDSNLE